MPLQATVKNFERGQMMARWTLKSSDPLRTIISEYCEELQRVFRPIMIADLWMSSFIFSNLWARLLVKMEDGCVEEKQSWSDILDFCEVNGDCVGWSWKFGVESGAVLAVNVMVGSDKMCWCYSNFTSSKPPEYSNDFRRLCCPNNSEKMPRMIPLNQDSNFHVTSIGDSESLAFNLQFHFWTCPNSDLTQLDFSGFSRASLHFLPSSKVHDRSFTD